MFVCCKRPENGCTGVPDCKCRCSGCLDEWDRFVGCDADADSEPGDDDGDPGEDSMEADTWGCALPGYCVMPGRHLKSECHTPEMLEHQE